MLRKNIILFILLTLCISTANADSMKILRLSDTSVTIGGKTLKEGDLFDEGASIKWNTPCQTMKAKNTRTGAIHEFSARQFASKKGISSVKDFFLRVNKASTRKAEGADFTFRESDVKIKFPDKRIALVIGNSNYINIASLRNPLYDAEAIAKSLGRLGFDVFEAYDCDYTDMISALNAFSNRAKNYDVAFFYYSGHGLQENNHNYLIPVQAELQLKSELNRCLDAYDVLDRMQDSGVESRIICIDACRDVKTSWTRSSSSGLTTMEGAPGTVIVCSTRSGQVALDGEGDNSPFAASFVNALDEKGLSFYNMMEIVVKNTYETTAKKQCPIVNGTLLSKFSFNPTGESISHLPSTPTKSTSDDTTIKCAQSAQTSITSKDTQTTKQTTQGSSTTSTNNSRQSATNIAAIECDAPDVRVSIADVKRSGSMVILDVMFVNCGSTTIKPSITEQAGNVGYVTSAWDSRGNEYSMRDGKMTPIKDNRNIYKLNLPPNVPVKMSYVIYDVPSFVYKFPLICLAFRSMNPYNSNGTALVKIFDVTLPQIEIGPRPSSNGIQIKTNIPDFKANVLSAKRAGTNVFIELLLTNIGSMPQRPYIQESIRYGTTSAWDANGNEYSLKTGLINMTKGGRQCYNLLLPPGVPVKLNVQIRNVSTNVTTLPLLTIAFSRLKTGASDGRCLLRIPNIKIQ